MTKAWDGMDEPAFEEPTPIAIVEICTTCGSRELGERIAARLLTDRQAACVQVEGPVTSHYVWEGRLEHATEWRCTCKTTVAGIDACVSVIRAVHDYTIPQIVVRHVRTSADYGGWVAANVASADEAPVLAATLAFDVVIHRRPTIAAPGPEHEDAWGRWPTLALSPADVAVPLPIGFEEVCDRLSALPRMFVEPDGSFVWRGEDDGRWQVDGGVYDRAGRVMFVELKGNCPAADFDRLAGTWGWPGTPFVVQLIRSGVYLDEATFRGQAAARSRSTG